MDLVLNKLQWLICHKTRPNETKNTYTDKLTHLCIYIYAMLIHIHTHIGMLIPT